MTKETIEEKILGLPSRQVVPYAVPMLIREFDFFNRFGKEALSLEGICGKFNFDSRVGDAMVSYLAKEGFLEYKSGRYTVSKTATDMLTTEANQDLTNYALLIDQVIPRKIPDSIRDALLTGKPQRFVDSSWEDSMKSGAISKSFSDGMMARAEWLKLSLADKMKLFICQGEDEKLLDLGGSLGDYCGAFTTAFNHLAATVYELPSVAEHTRKNIKEKGYKNVEVVSGDFFKDELPTGFNTHFYSNVMHDWKPREVVQLLRKSYKSLPIRGKVLVHDMHLNDNKTSPDYVVDHSLYLSIFTNGRCYSNLEMENFMERAGFDNVEYAPTLCGFGVVSGEKRK